MKKNITFLTTLVIIIITFSSCGTTYYGSRGGNGCGAWWPKKFERDNRHMNRMNWINNPRSGRYRSGIF